jgi:hypothetical protein
MSRTLDTALRREAAPPPIDEHRPSENFHRSRAMLRWDVATIALGLSFVVLVGLYGSTMWRVTRVILVVAVTLGALWIPNHIGRHRNRLMHVVKSP